ncbi:MAG: 50S ribosomal protein L17 [Patescibacteria group bacterium]|nr:50S ribosomal protein L17 [Patescibacteria group bacterium]MBU1876856.1 50S ribosomal protein L17 [Patescibacteria group bacterium]
MKKRIKVRKFNREKTQRNALMRELARCLFLRKKIKTTEAKAKSLAGFSQKLITRAKKGDLASRRILLKLFSSRVVKKLIEEIAPQYKDRKGGYTRIIKLNPRKSDGAKIAIIELVE